MSLCSDRWHTGQNVGYSLVRMRQLSAGRNMPLAEYPPPSYTPTGYFACSLTPASDEIWQYLFSEKINKTDRRGTTDAPNLSATEPQGSPRGQGPPRMKSDSIYFRRK